MEKIWGGKMNLGHFSYLFYMSIFTSIPILILWIKNFSFLKKNLKVFYIMILFSLIYSITDAIAIHWNAWFFTDAKILGIWIINIPIEDVIFAVLVTIAITSAVLTFIHYKDSGKFSKILHKR